VSPLFKSLITPFFAFFRRLLRTVAGEELGEDERRMAAAPDTWGQAMLVPLKLLVAVLLVWYDDRTLEPGPQMFTHLP